MTRRRPRLTPRWLVATFALVAAWSVALPAAAQDQSAAPVGPPAATPIANPPAVPSGDGSGVRFTTELGDIVIGVFTESSPVAAENFLNLASAGFYDGTVFHRIVPGFVIQGGDPTGTGSGDAGYSIVDEPVVGEYGRGIVAMARTQAPNSQGSQFFIVLDDAARAALDSARTYAIIGRVVEGMEVADAIAAGPSSGPPDDRALEPVAIDSTTMEQVVLPAEPSPPPPTTDEALASLIRLAVAGQQIAPQSVTGRGLEREFGEDDDLAVALRGIAEGLGRSLDDVSVAVGGASLPDGSLLDVTALRIQGAEGSAFLQPFAALITQDDTIAAQPATLAGRDAFALTGTNLPVAVAGAVKDDMAFLIRTDDEAARDELLSQLP